MAQFVDLLNKISNGISIEELVANFNEQTTSDYIVVYIRLITSGHLQKESEFFSNFIEGHRTVGEFCKQEVEPMYKESDHIHIIALTSEFKVPVRIVYMVSVGQLCPHWALNNVLSLRIEERAVASTLMTSALRTALNRCLKSTFYTDRVSLQHSNCFFHLIACFQVIMTFSILSNDRLFGAFY